ncbi:FixH family protein [Paracoccus ravus]|uniref:FixH family protein n=1 Tax=Paracoccus ravus TaxID=2447760 RepID=UPI00106EBB84|nr:FixH family protein [Paracoccus ravus]
MRGQLRGRHVLAITLTAFGTIIAVNLFMAIKAVGTFPGLETANSYVASQRFDRDRQSQQALGWRVDASYDGAEMTLAIRDAQGFPVRVRSLDVTVGRPTYVRDDLHPEFVARGGLFVTALDLAPGVWNIHLRATALDGTEFRQRIDHYHGSRVK